MQILGFFRFSRLEISEARVVGRFEGSRRSKGGRGKAGKGRRIQLLRTVESTLGLERLVFFKSTSKLLGNTRIRQDVVTFWQNLFNLQALLIRNRKCCINDGSTLSLMEKRNLRFRHGRIAR